MLLTFSLWPRCPPSLLPHPSQSPQLASPAPGVCSPRGLPKPVRTNSEGTHGDVEGEDGPPFKGKEKEPPSGKDVMFQLQLENPILLPTHDLTGISNGTFDSLRPTYYSPLDRAPPTTQPSSLQGLGPPSATPFLCTLHPRQWQVLPTLPPHPSLICLFLSIFLAPQRPTTTSHLQDPPSMLTLPAHCPREAT